MSKPAARIDLDVSLHVNKQQTLCERRSLDFERLGMVTLLVLKDMEW
jgi:hypothetical protein